jgi:hypothetical protein
MSCFSYFTSSFIGLVSSIIYVFVKSNLLAALTMVRCHVSILEDSRFPGILERRCQGCSGGGLHQAIFSFFSCGHCLPASLVEYCNLGHCLFSLFKAARAEYRTQWLTKIMGSSQRGVYAISLAILAMGRVRDYS